MLLAIKKPSSPPSIVSHHPFCDHLFPFFNITAVKIGDYAVYITSFSLLRLLFTMIALHIDLVLIYTRLHSE